MKKTLLKAIFIFFLTYSLYTIESTAQSIFTNQITGTNPNTSNPYTTITGGAPPNPNANITVSGIGRGSGIVGTNANDRYNANSWNAGSMDMNKYFEFTLTPNSGYEIDFTSFVYTGQASGTGPSSFAFRSSIDGFASNIGSPSATGTTINLSGAAYQNSTTPITFRLYGWGASGSGGTFSVNDFTFNGTVNTTVTVPCAAPSTQASNIAITPGSATAALTWVNGNGSKRVVKINTSNSFTAPANGTDPSATTAYSGSGEQVIYNGTGNLVNISGLNPTSTYYVRVYEVNCTGASTLYNTTTASGNPASFTTTAVVTVGTVLNPGDIAIVGYDAQVAGSGSGDLVAFVNMVDLAPGTTFLMTDNAFELASAPGVRDYTWGNGEGVVSITWNGPGTLTKGTVTQYKTDAVPAGWSRSCVSDRNGATNGGCDVTAFNFATAGDQLFILQGTWSEGTYNCPGTYYDNGGTGCANATFSGRYIFGFNGIDPGWISTNQTPITIAGTGEGARNSRLPRELRCFNTELTTTTTRRQYKDASTDNGTQRKIIGTIKNTGDWANFSVGGFSLSSFNISAGWVQGKWIGDVNTNWFNCSNWDNLLVPDSTINVTLDSYSDDDAEIDALAQYSDEFMDIAECKNLVINDKSVVLEGSPNDVLKVYGNLTLNASDGLDMSDGSNGTPDGQLYLYGNWLNKVAEVEFKQGESTVHFVGKGIQTITSDDDDNETFYNVVINKPSGTVNLTGDDDMTIDVGGKMTFISGIVNSDNTAGSHVIFETTATTTGANVNSFVNGPVQKKTNSTALFTFPVGDVTTVNLYRPLALVASSTNSSLFEAEYTGFGYGNYTLGTGIADVTEKEWWRFDRNSGSANATLTPTWGAESDIPNELTTDISHLRVARFDGNNWDDMGGNGATGNTTAGKVTSNVVSVFGPFTLGVDVPLPVQLVSFNVLYNNGTALLNWNTMCEINCHGFEIQQSENGIDFYPIGFVKSTGSPTSKTSYTFEKEIPFGTDHYYRLKIIDYDNTYEYSVVRHLNTAMAGSLYVYPNPTASGIHIVAQNIDIASLEHCVVQVINVVGAEIISETGTFTFLEKKLDLQVANLASGVYLVRITLGGHVYDTKLVKE